MISPTDKVVVTQADREWLIRQLEAWPTRVDPGKTTNIEFMMKSAAEAISRLEAEKRELVEALEPLNEAVSEVEALSKAMAMLGRGDMVSPIETDILVPLRRARSTLSKLNGD